MHAECLELDKFSTFGPSLQIFWFLFQIVMIFFVDTIV